MQQASFPLRHGKLLGLGLALLLSTAGTAASAAAPVKAVWIGGPTLLFRFGPLKILTDPVLGTSFRMIDPNSGTPDASHLRLRPLPESDVDDADLILISHDHADHLDETAIAKLSQKAFIAPLQQVSTIRARGVQQVLGLPWRATHTISKDGYFIRITAVPAQHSIQPEAQKLLGEVNGYWIEFSRGNYRRTVYWTGDSFPIPAEFSKAYREPDLLVPHLGGVGADGPFGQVSMGASDAVAFARAVEPKEVLPIHHSTFSLYREPIDLFAKAAAGEPWKLAKLAEGEELVLQ